MKKISKKQINHIRELLRDKSARDKSGLFVVEGEKIIKDSVSTGYHPEFIVFSKQFTQKALDEEILKKSAQFEGELLEISDKDLEKLSSLKTSQGILAVFKKINFSKALIEPQNDSLHVLCDNVQDPGNLGAIMRSAAGFGAECVFLKGDTADIYNPKVVRASSGAVLNVPSTICSIDELKDLQVKGCRLLVGSPNSETSKNIIETARIKGPVIIAFGSEGRGVSAEVDEIADEFFCIPIEEKIESLNVAIAAGIALYVFSQGRKKAERKR
ncbi:MAG: RNA methyltransferase [Candidatus Omnitrophota bacterium]